MIPKLFIICSEQGRGKTTYLQHIIHLLKKKNVKTGGILAKGNWKNNQRESFVLIDLCSEAEIVFCQRKATAGWEKIRRFYVNPNGQSFGEKALSKQTLQECQVVIIDEIGPFELMGKGWSTPLEKLLEEPDLILVISVRKSLVEEVVEHWKMDNYTIQDINKIAPEEGLKEILQNIF